MIPIALDDRIRRALASPAHVAMSVSGGADSAAMAIQVSAHLDAIGHPHDRRMLIHADLGQIEWRQTAGMVEQLARFLDMPLAIVQYPGGMIERWRARWASSLRRYADFNTVTLVGPWSNAQWRFCTSELKTAKIFGHLTSTLRDTTILSVVGIRRDESDRRRLTPISKPETGDKGLTRIRRRLSGMTWNPLALHSKADVVRVHEHYGFPLHPAYTEFASSRLSCSFCVLARFADLVAASRCQGNHDAYRLLIDLEAESAFSFQPAIWLGDVAPHLLDERRRHALADAKTRAGIRRRLEHSLPAELRYDKDGWPPRLPTAAEARLLGHIRQEIGRLHDIPVRYTDPDAIVALFAQLLARRTTAPATVRSDPQLDLAIHPA